MFAPAAPLPLEPDTPHSSLASSTTGAANILLDNYSTRGLITDGMIRRGAFGSVRELEPAIYQWLATGTRPHS